MECLISFSAIYAFEMLHFGVTFTFPFTYDSQASRWKFQGFFVGEWEDGGIRLQGFAGEAQLLASLDALIGLAF